MALKTKNARGQYKKAPVTQQALTQESSGEQQPGRSDVGGHINAMVGGAMLYGNAGWDINPMAFPGYNFLYTGSYVTYRWMLQNPILRLVRSIDVGIVGASTWEFEKADKEVPDAWVDLVETCFAPLRDHLINQFMVRGRDYGWSGGEPIWEHRNGRTWLKRVKPLLPDVSEILKDPHGNFAGIRNNVRPNDQQNTAQADLWAPYKAWIYTYDGEAGYLYGRSWLENVRMTAWRDWLDCMQQLQKLGTKITGIVTIITSPAGAFPGPVDPATGIAKQVSYQSNAEMVIKALAGGAAGAWFPSLGLNPDAKGNIDAMKVLIDMAGKSLTNINVLDFGTQAPAIAGLLERMKHDEELMFAGGLRSARTGLEAKHGTKEEAGTHTDTGTLNAEIDDRDFALQCQPLVDAFLALNVHEGAVGRVRIKTPSLVDRKSSVVRAVLLALLNNQHFQVEYAKSLDIDKSSETLGMTMKNPFDAAAVEKAAADANKPQPGTVKNPEPQGGRPPQN